MNDWEDRCIDSALQELHGSRPPDLSARVVLALHEAKRGALPELAPARRPSRRRWAVAAAAALTLCAAIVGALLSQRPPTNFERVVQLDVHVRAGRLECLEFTGAEALRSQHGAGSTAVFAARTGNRLQCAEPCRFQVGPLGELATGPATTLEVRSMSVSWKHGAVAASSLTVAVVAGVVTWHTLSQEGTAKAGEVVHLTSPAQPVEAAASTAELEHLRERLQQLEQQNADLQLQLARERVTTPPPPPQEAAPDEPPPPPADAGPIFTDERYAATLGALDWKLMGEVTNEMAPMLVELAKALEEGKELPMDLAAKIQELNAKLVAQVPALLKSGLPGSGPNGAYTHPLVAANILAKTLDAAGLGMDAAQRDRIAGLVRLFSAEVQSVADSQQEFDVQRLAAEAESKDRFYREMSLLLSPEQQRVMFPDGATKYDGTSLFSSSLFTRQYVDGVSASNPAEFARSVANTCGEQLGLDDQASSQVRAIVERMSGAAPELWQDPAGKVERDLRMLKAGRTAAATQRQIAVMREILRQVPMTPEQRQKFVAMKRLFVPLPK